MKHLALLSFIKNYRMRKIICTTMLLLLTFAGNAGTPVATKSRVCLAYVTNRLRQIPDPTLVTHINFSFAEVYVENNEYRGFKLQGNDNVENFKKVIELKKINPNLKILVSFSDGVSNKDNHRDGGFSAIAASKKNRKAFAKDCLEFVKKWGIDGIDLDWEMPGISWGNAACDPINDVDNYTLLMKQLRKTLCKNYLLTLAGYVMDKQRQDNGEGWKFFDLKAIKPYINWVNIMTYDLDDGSKGRRGFNSAVKSSTSFWDVERTIEAYTAAGYDASQMVIGIPFYVRHSFEHSADAAIIYRERNKYTEEMGFKFDNWDDEAMVPYVTKDGVFYGSYENERSIAIKGDLYVGTGKVRGLMYWEASHDDSDYQLSRACWNAVMKKY